MRLYYKIKLFLLAIPLLAGGVFFWERVMGKKAIVNGIWITYSMSERRR
jgi:hypothetical protein